MESVLAGAPPGRDAGIIRHGLAQQWGKSRQGQHLMQSIGKGDQEPSAIQEEAAACRRNLCFLAGASALALIGSGIPGLAGLTLSPPPAAKGRRDLHLLSHTISGSTSMTEA